MKEYIEREALKTKLKQVITNVKTVAKNEYAYGYTEGMKVACAQADAIPTAGVVERVHGEWIQETPDAWFESCSVCGAWYDVLQGTNGGEMYFCPNCGADMRGYK